MIISKEYYDSFHEFMECVLNRLISLWNEDHDEIFHDKDYAEYLIQEQTLAIKYYYISNESDIEVPNEDISELAKLIEYNLFDIIRYDKTIDNIEWLSIIMTIWKDLTN